MDLVTNEEGNQIPEAWIVTFFRWKPQSEHVGFQWYINSGWRTWSIRDHFSFMVLYQQFYQCVAMNIAHHFCATLTNGIDGTFGKSQWHDLLILSEFAVVTAPNSHIIYLCDRVSCLYIYIILLYITCVLYCMYTICEYIYIYIYKYVSMYLCIYLYIYMYMYICIDVHMYIFIYVHMYIFIYVHMYICIYVYFIHVISHVYHMFITCILYCCVLNYIIYHIRFYYIIYDTT